MKNLITILLLFFATLASAQVTIKTKATVNLTPSKFSFNITGTTADSLGVYQDSLIWPINWYSVDSMTTYVRAKITEVTSACNITAQFQVKRFATDVWTTAATKTYTGVGADTTLTFQTLVTHRTHPYMRLVFIRNANKAYISGVSGWIFK
jgi:hypothetical protein